MKRFEVVTWFVNAALVLVGVVAVLVVTIWAAAWIFYAAEAYAPWPPLPRIR